VNHQQSDRFIYIVGEQQNGVIPESPEVFAYAGGAMGQIDTKELAMVIANVFAKGQYFPGSDGALASVIHEFVSRSDRFKREKSKRKKGRCTIITALKRLDGEISVKVAAVTAVSPGSLQMEAPQGFHDLLVATLPEYQEVFTEEAYAPDSKLIEIVKESTLHHITSRLQ